MAFVFLWATVNLLSAVLAVAACLFYVFVYTLWLKRTSSQQHRDRRRRRCRAGAHRLELRSPARLDWAPVVLFAIIFYWTPPHFWALAIRYRDDYAAADVPMLPAVVSLRRTAGRILAYTLLLWALTVAVRAGGRAWGTSTSGRRSCSAASSPSTPSGCSACPIPGSTLAASGGAAEARGPGHRDAPVHLVDHLHHAAVRGHGPRPAAAVRMVTIAAARHGFEGGRVT